MPTQYLDFKGLQYYTKWLREKILKITPVNETDFIDYEIILSGNERAHIVPIVDKPVNIKFGPNDKRNSTITQEVYFTMGDVLTTVAFESPTQDDIKWVKTPIFYTNKTYLISVTITNVEGIQYPVGMFVEMD